MIGPHADAACRWLAMAGTGLAASLLAAGLASAAPVAPARPAFLIGADISWVPQQEAEGRVYRDAGKPREILSLLKEHGFNAVRLRVFHNPKAPKGYSAKGYCSLEETLRLAKRVKAAGMSFLLDFHYSDNWADPQKQFKPSAWAGLSGEALERAVRDYTRETLLAFKAQGTLPEMVQVGNEISSGFLWPDGELAHLDTMCALLRAGIAGVREVDPAIRVMVHLAHGGQNQPSRWFLDNIRQRGVEFDVLGQSYYRQWHGTLAELKSNLEDLAARYPYPIVLVEYSVPDLRATNDIVHALPGGKGIGSFIWEPTGWREALFDPAGNAKPELDEYPKIAAEYGPR